MGMKLVLIFGPPAVGKLSVARALAGITGYKVFHNHASVDFVGTIFEFGTPQFSRLVVRFRMEMLRAAAMSGINTIFTSAYVKGRKSGATMRLVRTVKEAGGDVCFVMLKCDRAELMRRVVSRSRRAHGKIVDRRKLAQFLSSYDTGALEGVGDVLEIDNTRLGPKVVAQMIARHFGLRPVRHSARRTSSNYKRQALAG